MQRKKLERRNREWEGGKEDEKRDKPVKSIFIICGIVINPIKFLHISFILSPKERRFLPIGTSPNEPVTLTKRLMTTNHVTIINLKQ